MAARPVSSVHRTVAGWFLSLIRAEVATLLTASVSSAHPSHSFHYRGVLLPRVLQVRTAPALQSHPFFEEDEGGHHH